MRAFALTASFILAGCFGDAAMDVSREPAPVVLPDVEPEEPVTAAVIRMSADRERAAVPGAEALAYARRIAPMLVQRTLTADEVTALSAQGGTYLPTLLSAWVKEPGFADAARMFISVKLKASGQKDGINFELPGNLAAALARDDRPWREILTADSCVDGAGANTACDTGAPYAAGVLSTRAFLANNAGRFNLKRARNLMLSFACRDYPMAPEVQPSLPRESLIPLFQQDKVEDPTGVGSFGNGFACYTCHSQFGAHAQIFVKYDSTGLYRANATGLQDPNAEAGRSSNGLFTSHMSRPEEAAVESSQIFGKRITSLPEAARAIADSPHFLSCSVKQLVGFTFGLSDSIVQNLPAETVAEIVTAAKARRETPSLGTLAIEAFSHPAVIFSLRPPEGAK